MKKIILSLLMIFSFAGLFAQEVEFTADRPGASTGPSTVAKGIIQWEQSVQYNGDGGKGAFTFSSTMFRYGLFDGVELRLSGDGFMYDNANRWKTAFSGVTIGSKIRRTGCSALDCGSCQFLDSVHRNQRVCSGELYTFALSAV